LESELRDGASDAKPREDDDTPPDNIEVPEQPDDDSFESRLNRLTGDR